LGDLAGVLTCNKMRGITRLAFPRTQGRLPEVFGHQQLTASTCHDPTPPFDLLRRAQVRLGPEQVLLEKVIAMFSREPP